MKGYFTESMEARIAMAHVHGRNDQISRFDPLLKKAQALRQQAIHGDETARNLALEAFLHMIGETFAEVTQPCLTLSRELIDLETAVQGDLVKGQFTISNSTRGYLAGEVTSNAGWLMLKPGRSQCLAGDYVVMSVASDTAKLRGSSQGAEQSGSTEVISNSGRRSVKAQVQVGTPALHLQPKSLDFGRISKGEIAVKWLEIHSPGFGFLEGKVEASEPWLKLSSRGFRCPSAKVARRKITADTAKLKPGTYRAGVDVTINCGVPRIPCALVVVPPPTLAVATRSLRFDLAKGIQSTEVKNAGTGIPRVQLSSAVSWLVIEPSTLELGEQQSAEVRVRVHYGRLLDSAAQTEVTIASSTDQEKVRVFAMWTGPPPQRSRQGWVLDCPSGETFHAKSEEQLTEFLAAGCWINDELPRRPAADLQPDERLYGVVKQRTAHGAIVDIGAERDGRLHVSRFRRTDAKHLDEIAKPGATFVVWVTDTYRRDAVSLTMTDPSAMGG